MVLGFWDADLCVGQERVGLAFASHLRLTCFLDHLAKNVGNSVRVIQICVQQITWMS